MRRPGVPFCCDSPRGLLGQVFSKLGLEEGASEGLCVCRAKRMRTPFYFFPSYLVKLECPGRTSSKELTWARFSSNQHGGCAARPCKQRGCVTPVFADPRSVRSLRQSRSLFCRTGLLPGAGSSSGAI